MKNLPLSPSLLFSYPLTHLSASGRPVRVCLSVSVDCKHIDPDTSEEETQKERKKRDSVCSTIVLEP